MIEKIIKVFVNTKNILLKKPLKYIAILTVSPLILTSVITLIVYVPYFLKLSEAGKSFQFNLLFFVEWFIITAIATFVSIMIIEARKKY